jgi:hypothetical protein
MLSTLFMITFVSTRFNNETFQENRDFVQRIWNSNPYACIYCSPHPMSQKIIQESMVFVVEMNNSKNQIEGIGLIQNIPLKSVLNVYETRNFNRYVYKGNYRVDRDELLIYNSKIVNILDYILFKEKTHMKRGAGFTTIPLKLWNHSKCEGMDIPFWLRSFFVEKFAKNNISLH